MPVNAHLMVAERGTLNFDETGAYTVISLSASNFVSADTNRDGHLSFTEFKQAKETIFKQVLAGIYMQQDKQVRYLEGLMLSPQASHHGNGREIDQIIVMGKFTNVDHTKNLSFHNVFYGDKAHSSVEITAKYKRLGLKKAFVLTSKKQGERVF
ncbi:hypothetical protein [Pseudoalteromonas luteoviolacea]|uniref:hypothetical protein n=1 Tax=Pseudoalteromonas luteoviolacea TaxID=43657 RepID=UPI000A54F9A7|nr:hypothetical protein [Pseudoalteromonas luteoviolacea]